MRQPDAAVELAATAREFETAMTPPGWIYCDADLYARDIAEIFGRMWLCVGHRSRLENPGDFFVVEVGQDSIVLAADRLGTARAFLNVCRHRGTRVVREARGNCRGFLCPYHAWNYDLDGSLRVAPQMEATVGFERADYPLVSVRLEQYLGFIFINLDSQAAPLTSSFADLPDLSRFDIPNLVRVGYHDYSIAANWKLICENYHECYHCALAHPQLHRISDHGQLKDVDACGENYIGGPMAIKERFNSLTMSGISTRKPLAGCRQEDLGMVHYFNLLPNLLLSICPDYVLAHYILPRGAENVYVETEWFCSQEQVADPSFDAADAIEFWDTTNRQDWALCENAQRGLRSTGHVPGRYQSGEYCSQRFDRWYIEKLFAEIL